MIRAIAIACFFLSGFAGLVYEVCWIRKASLVFGSTTFALSSVLAIFFGGLALGSWLFGRIAQRTVRPLRMYAVLEVGLAVMAVLSPFLFDLLDGVYGVVYRAAGGGGMLLFVLRFVLVAMVLLPPTVLMGGTLPLFCRQFVLSEKRIAGSVGFLYGVNTLGAALGCAAAGFWLLPMLGVHWSIRLAAVLNIVAAVTAWRLPLSVARAPRKLPAAKAAGAAQAGAQSVADGGIASHYRLVVGALFFMTGFLALGVEVAWTRYLALLVRNSVYTYTITLTVVLVGIVLGSLLAAWMFDRVRSRAFWFGILQAISALSVLALILLPVTFWRGLGQNLTPYFVLMLLPAVCSGALFPLANRLVLDDPRLSAISVGRMTAINTMGGIVGSLAIGFAGLPLLGLAISVRAVTGLGVLTACAAWLLLPRAGARWLRGAMVVVAVAAWFIVPRVLDTRVPADFLAPRERLVDYKEGHSSSLAVIRNKGRLHLEIDRLWQGSDGKNHQIMAAHLPMLSHPDPKSVLLVGTGTGQTASRFLMYDIERLDCVDIEPAIFPVIAEHFSADWMRDTRVTLIEEDGRTVLTHAAATYDVISVEVGQVFRPGVESLYTVEFYRRAAKKLNTGGMLSQFVPLPFLEVEDFRSMVRTFLEVFPNSYLWYNTAELLLIGVKAESYEFPAERLRLLGADAAINADLRYAHWGGREHWLNQPEVLMGMFLCGPAELAAMTRGAGLYRDDRPALAYATSEIDAAERKEVPIIEVLRRYLSSPPGGIAESALVEAMREQNLDDLVASAHLRSAENLQGRANPARLAELLQIALRWNPQSVAANRMLGDALTMAGRMADAAPYFEAAIALQDNDALSHRGLALVLLQTGRGSDAIPHLRTAMAQLPEDATSHNYMGAALAGQGRMQEAIRHFEQALRLRPGYPDAGQNLERARQQLTRQGASR